MASVAYVYERGLCAILLRLEDVGDRKSDLIINLLLAEPFNGFIRSRPLHMCHSW